MNQRNEFVLHEDDLLRALDELAEIVEIICAPIIPPAPEPAPRSDPPR